MIQVVIQIVDHTADQIGMKVLDHIVMQVADHQVIQEVIQEVGHLENIVSHIANQGLDHIVALVDHDHIVDNISCR